MEKVIDYIEKILWYSSIVLLIIACLGAGCENTNEKTAERRSFFCLVSLRFSEVFQK